MIYGTFGIGKSFLIRDTAKEISEEKGKKFVEWDKTDKEEKQKVIEYPENYFVLLDIRLSSYDSTDIRGLPDFKNGRETIEWKIPTWAKFLTLENSDGIVFFDEIGLATPLTISSCYQILYDRVIIENKINDNWFIVGATNLASDRAYTHDIAPPLKDRCSEIELSIPNAEDWTIEFAIPNKIDSRIIGFLNFKKSNLHKVDFDDSQKFVTPRSWERISKLIDGVKDWKILRLICQSAIGEGTASEFVSFLKISEKLNLEDIIKNPKKIKDIKDISVKFFLVSALSERYSEKKVDFKRIMEASEVLDEIKNPEFVALLWRLCSSYTEKCKRFKKDFLNDTKYDKFKEQYGKYIV